MKIEQLIVQYLYTNKKVTLQDIGTFIVSDDITIPTDIEKDTVLPENAIQFKYDPKALADDGLIDYVIQNTRKIRPLATSDLESFVMLNKQFLNIGKPLVMEGLGTLQKVNDGSYTFVQSNTSHVVIKDAPKLVTEKLKEKISFATPEKVKNDKLSKGLIIGLLSMLAIGAIATAIYLFKPKSENKNNINVIAKDTLKNENITPINQDTIAIPKTIASPKIITADSNTFYIVEKEYPNLVLATKRIAQLKSYGDKAIMVTKDSITYKIKIGFKKPIADTLRIKDSVASQYGTKGKSYVEIP